MSDYILPPAAASHIDEIVEMTGLDADAITRAIDSYSAVHSPLGDWQIYVEDAESYATELLADYLGTDEECVQRAVDNKLISVDAETVITRQVGARRGSACWIDGGDAVVVVAY